MFVSLDMVNVSGLVEVKVGRCKQGLYKVKVGRFEIVRGTEMGVELPSSLPIEYHDSFKGLNVAFKLPKLVLK